MAFLRRTPAFSPVLQEGGGNPRWTPCVCECCRPWPAGPSPRPRRSQSRGAAPPGVPARGPPCWPAPPLPHTPDQAWAEAAGVTRCVQAPRALERGEQARAALSEAAASAHRFAGCGPAAMRPCPWSSQPLPSPRDESHRPLQGQLGVGPLPRLSPLGPRHSVQVGASLSRSSEDAGLGPRMPVRPDISRRTGRVGLGAPGPPTAFSILGDLFSLPF